MLNRVRKSRTVCVTRGHGAPPSPLLSYAAMPHVYETHLPVHPNLVNGFSPLRDTDILSCILR